MTETVEKPDRVPPRREIKEVGQRSGHLRPLRWMLPLAAALLVLGAWTSVPDRAVDKDGEAHAEPSTADAGGPLAPVLLRGSDHRRTDPSTASDSPAPQPAAERQQHRSLRGQEMPAEGPEPATPTVPVAPMARFEGLTLYVPSVDPVLVGFHEAGTRDGFALEPVGPLIENNNTTRFEAPTDDPDGTPYRILHSRGRLAAPTSAVDIAMRDDDPVLSPVAGDITDVREFYLGGRHRDVRVEIRPDAAPELRVILIHLDGIEVVVGDRVEAGTTVVAASARRFPFASQIDYVIEDGRWPHVHIEVKPEDAPRPGDG